MTPALLLAASLVSPAVAADPYVTASDRAGRSFHLRLDTDATWGIGSQMYLGALTHLEGQLPVWQTGSATGTVDLGLRVAYGNEGRFFAFWLDPDEVTGATHRVATQVALGTTFHLTRQRRVGLGVHLLGGWGALIADYDVTYAQEGFSADARSTRHDFLLSADATLSYRASRFVGVNLALTAPLPTQSSYVVGLCQIGAGLSFYLR